MPRLILAYTWHGQLRQRLFDENLITGDLVVLNPSNGPVPDDPAEQAAVASVARSVGLSRCYGYIPLAQGNRPWREIYRDASTWINQFGLSNMFFDECPPDLNKGEFHALTSVSLRTILNPGVAWKGTPTVGQSTIIVTREGEYTNAPPPNARIPHGQQACIAYNTTEKAKAVIRSGFGYGYATADTLPNPYDGKSNG